MTTLKVGIATYDEMKARTMAVARGERRVSRDEPKVWFTSTESFAKVLSASNRELLLLPAAQDAALAGQELAQNREIIEDEVGDTAGPLRIVQQTDAEVFFDREVRKDLAAFRHIADAKRCDAE